MTNHMMPKVTAVLLSAPLLLGLAGCKWGSSGPSPLIPVHITSANTYAMGPCPSGMDVERVIRVVIRGLDVASIKKREVKYKSKPFGNETIGDVVEDGTINDQTNDTEVSSNPYHVDASVKGMGDITSSANPNADVYARVRIVLKNSNYEFYKDTNIDTVGYGDKAYKDLFCVTGAPQGKTLAIFYLKMNHTNGVTVGYFNVGIRPAQSNMFGYETPVFIDPKVLNQG